MPNAHDPSLYAHRRAQCCCGALHLICAGAPKLVSLCHCPACQRRTGAPFGIAAFYPEQQVKVTGQTHSYTRPSDSGYDITFHFCPTCASTLFWYPHRKPGLVAVAAGAFADPAFPPPTQEVYTEHRQNWLGPLVP